MGIGGITINKIMKINSYNVRVEYLIMNKSS